MTSPLEDSASNTQPRGMIALAIFATPSTSACAPEDNQRSLREANRFLRRALLSAFDFAVFDLGTPRCYSASQPASAFSMSPAIFSGFVVDP